MSITINTITFDHGRHSPTTCTVPLRYNEAVPVLLPEWQLGQTLPSVAAYRVDRLPPTVEVEVTLTASPDEPRTQEIRALTQPLPRSFPPPLPLIAGLMPRIVIFDRFGGSGGLRFRFDTTAMRAGIAAETVGWLWQARAGASQPWRNLGMTSHRFYTLLAAPTAPWLVEPADPANTALPRTDMLDFACSWAHGADNAVEAAKRITQAVNDLGGNTFRYDALVGAPHYTLLGVPLLLCDALVDRLLGGQGAGQLVNCSDCATIVATMANLLGADLWQSKMGLVGDGFPLNPILGIGSSGWSRLHGGFTFHEVAWAGDCEASDVVFDASLQVDGDRNPTRAPHAPKLPCGDVFEGPAGTGFRDEIAAPKGRDLCVPQPALRIRRPISWQAALPARSLPARIKRDVSARLGITDQVADAPADNVVFQGIDHFGNELPNWMMQGRLVNRAALPETPLATALASAAGHRTAMSTQVVVSLWVSQTVRGGRLRLETTETASSDAAKALALGILAEIERPGLQRRDRDIGGEVAVWRPDGSFVLATCGNLVNVLYSVGPSPMALCDEADAFNQWLNSAGVAVADNISLPQPHWSRWTFSRRSAPPTRHIVTPSLVGDGVKQGKYSRASASARVASEWRGI
jgi:hypothetical protein